MLSDLQLQTLSQSATSRGTSKPPQSWVRAWKTKVFMQRLSGLTCPPLTASRGVEQWIASLAATRVSPTVSPVPVLDPMMTVSLSTNLFGSSVKCGLPVCSERTSQGMRTDSLPCSSQHWSDWATALRREFSARRKWAHPTGASDYSSWATPVTRDYFPPHTAAYIAKKKSQGHGMRNLNDEVAFWATPQTRDFRAGEAHRWDDPARSQTLNDQVDKWPTPMAGTPAQNGNSMAGNSDFSRRVMALAETWPMPCVVMFKGSSPDSVTRVDGKSRMDRLDYATEQGFPISPRGRQVPDGSMFSPHTRFLRRALLIWTRPRVRSRKQLRAWVIRVGKKRLNPYFVEWLMGWPRGWTDYGHAVTGFAQWQARSRGYLCQLILRTGET